MAWYLEEGPESDVVISTRVRLARNLAHTPFPWRLDASELDYVKERVTEAFCQSCLEEGEKPLIADLEDLDPIILDALAERRIISPKMTRQTQGKALLLFPGESRGILVNEEDHLRIYAVSAGLKLQETANQALACAASLEAKLPLAKSDRLGYLTACPTNTGTGMRASVMLHVPGLVRSGVIKALAGKLAKSGYALRGSGGEGTGIEADMIQLSNQVTLGVHEEAILDSLDRLVLELAQEERKARQTLYARDPLALEDEIARSKGQLMNARLMTEEEAKEGLSKLRLGRELHLADMPGYGAIQQLLTSVGQAAIQEEAGRPLTDRESQERRAQLVRRSLGDKEEVNTD
ncbi:MAG TPA: ATP--guanido phosphotransferase [Clostridia bacterium]|nr:ATP--guanido phosphotransferase [Clostridia bacterium]